MQEADLVRFKHMLDAAREISKFTHGINKVQFEKDRKLHLSVVRLLEIIGEAASKVSPEIKSENKQIPWNSIIGMRNRLIHGYFDIDLEIVLVTVKTDIPELLNELEKIINKSD